MGLIEDFRKLPVKIQVIILSLGGFMPFWFVIIWVFYPEFMTYGFYEKLMIVGAPTILWYLIELWLASMILNMIPRKVKMTISEAGFGAASALNGLFYLLLIAIICYLADTTLSRFLWIAFSVRLFTVIFISINIKLQNKSNNSKYY